MSLFARLFGRRSPAAVVARSQTFAINIDPAMIWGTGSSDDAASMAPPALSRAWALRIPAVKRARDLVAGAIGQFPLTVTASDGTLVTDPTALRLFTQPEVGIPAVTSIANLVEDLMLYSRAWWYVDSTDWWNRPVDVVWMPADAVNVLPAQRVTPYGVVETWPAHPGLIRFDGPGTGLLDAGRRALRALARLETAATNYADGTPPLEAFESADGVDPDDEDVAEFLAAYKAARRSSSTAYIPAAYKRSADGAAWNPEQLQLAAAREFAITEVARLTGIDAEELSVSTTSRTYANMQDRRRHFVENTLGPYMRAIEQRLSMDDITPRGTTVRFDTSAFLRLDDAAAASADKTLIDARVLTRDEARSKRGLPPLPAGELEPPAPAPADPADPADPAPTPEEASA